MQLNGRPERIDSLSTTKSRSIPSPNIRISAMIVKYMFKMRMKTQPSPNIPPLPQRSKKSDTLRGGIPLINNEETSHYYQLFFPRLPGAALFQCGRRDGFEGEGEHQRNVCFPLFTPSSRGGARTAAKKGEINGRQKWDCFSRLRFFSCYRRRRNVCDVEVRHLPPFALHPFGKHMKPLRRIYQQMRNKLCLINVWSWDRMFTS